MVTQFHRFTKISSIISLNFVVAAVLRMPIAEIFNFCMLLNYFDNIFKIKTLEEF